jgi:WD40 repeat protein
MATGTRTKSNLGPLRLWDLTTRQEVAVLATNFWLRSTIVFSPDSKLLVFLDFYKGLRLWNLAAHQEITNLPAYFHYQSPLGVAFSPNGQTLAYNVNEGGDIVLWDVRTQSAIGGLPDISVRGRWLFA